MAIVGKKVVDQWSEGFGHSGWGLFVGPEPQGSMVVEWAWGLLGLRLFKGLGWLGW